MPARQPVPEETKKIIRDLWMQGYSSLYIGNRTGKTRRAVIGVVNRLGLMRVERPGNPSPTRQTYHNQYTGRKAVKPLKAILGHKQSDGEPVSIKDIPMPEPSVAAKNGYRVDGKLVGLMDLRWNSCRWPVGDPVADENFGYCGAQSAPACPYCVIHKKIAYGMSRTSGHFAIKVRT